MSNDYLFVNFKLAKIIWIKLDAKYGSDDAGKKKYVVDKWQQFQIVDDKPIMEQLHTHENLCTEVLADGMNVRNPSSQRADRKVFTILE